MREQYVGSHKYGSPFAAYLDERQEWADYTVGDVNDYGYHFAKYDRHVLVTDSQGFVTHHRLSEGEWDAIVTEWETWTETMGDDR